VILELHGLVIRQWKDFVHILPVVVEDNDTECLDPLMYIVVCRSAGGDYYVTAFRRGDISGGEIEHCDSLIKAKRFAEKIAFDGAWIDYLYYPNEEKLK